jgi:penicillin-binding protein 1C
MFHRVKKHIKKVRKQWWYRHTKAIVLCLLSIVFISGGIFSLWVAQLEIPDLTAFQSRKVAESTKIYDRSGQILLYDIHEDAKRTIVPFVDISPYIKSATIAIEDTDFYHHIGIKPVSIMRAILVDIFTRGYDQGGSTITQQVIKNSVLTTDKTITRKIKEWVLAIKLERVMTKDEILSTYLNETSYGGNIFGVQEASKTFFGKDAKDVTLAEAAYIAALPQAPSLYSPYGQNKALLDARQKLVLKQMLTNKLISQNEYTGALAQKVSFLSKNTSNIRAPHFSLYVKNYLEQKYGEETVLNGGLKVITSLNYDMQQKMEEVVADFGPRISQQFGASNTAMVAIDPKTGDLLAMIGSRDYYNSAIDGNFNIATAYRQPGSTFKPFVYATLFEKGYTPDTVLFDVKTEFSSECTPDSKTKDPTASTSICYSPNDYDDIFDGPINIRTALAQSRNVPAVKALYLAGISNSIQTAESMGLTSLTDPNRYGLTLVLGGGEVSLLEMTSAYGVFANDGVRNPYRSILEVDDKNGNVLEKASANPTQAIPSQTARQIDDILSDTNPKVRMQSLAQLIQPMGRSVAIKTGTTNDYRDVWAIGYTPNLVVGAWAGKNNNTPMDKKVAGLIIAPVWGAFMSKVLPTMPVENFLAPDPTPFNAKPVLRGVWQGGVSYKIDTVSGKVATQYTPQELQKEVVFPSIHSILTWVDKTNPTGPTPNNPGNDSQYQNWEYGVRTWFTEWQKTHPDFKEVIPGQEIIPTATDDVHTPENAPKVTISNYKSGDTVNQNSRVTILYTTTVKYPIQKAELYVNNKFILNIAANNNSISFVPNDIEGIDGDALVKIVVYDSVLNKGFDTVDLTVNQQ